MEVSCVQALREWQAFNDCKHTIDDFLEQLPLFKMLAHKAMRPRHWQEIMRSTGASLLLVALLLSRKQCREVAERI